MTALEPEVLKSYMPDKKKAYKLNRNRGLGWEDELTKELNKSRFMYCYNLGGSTTHIPDIFVMADKYVHEGKNIQLTVDKNPISEKLIYGPFVMAVECKYTTDDKILIPKNEVDKCFEFLGQLSKYQRFVLLAFKFKNGLKPIKHFVLIEYDPIYVNTDYDFFMMDRGGLSNFYNKGVNQHRPPYPHPVLGASSICLTKTRVWHGEFNLERA